MANTVIVETTTEGILAAISETPNKEKEAINPQYAIMGLSNQ